MEGQTRPGEKSGSEDRQEEGYKLRFCTVCASNNNRYVVLWRQLFCRRMLILGTI